MSKDPKTIEYVPVSEWPDLEALAVGYHEHLMPPSDDLASQSFELIFEDGSHILHSFKDATTLTLETKGELQSKANGDTSATQEYKAFEVRPGVFFIDSYSAKNEEQVSLVLDTTTGRVVRGLSAFYDVAGERRTKTTFSNARISTHGEVKPFSPTDALVGKHILYRYTPRDWYEHVYLNRGTFTWHCVDGTEKGLADTEPCKVLELGEDLYLLFWSETIMPVESFVVVDLKKMRSTGRFFCWDPKPNRMVRMLFGSHATILAETSLEAVVASIEKGKIQ